MTTRDSVAAGVRSELRKLGAAATVEGRIALNLAKTLDDRVGAQAGGSAATAKALKALMDGIRDEHKPKGASRLELLRGGDVGAAG